MAAAESPADLGWVGLNWVKTSAHTLAYAFILLALYPEEQEKFYQNIKAVLSDGRVPVRFSRCPFSTQISNI